MFERIYNFKIKRVKGFFFLYIKHNQKILQKLKLKIGIILVFKIIKLSQNDVRIIRYEFLRFNEI